jgi:hypothetical protein
MRWFLLVWVEKALFYPTLIGLGFCIEFLIGAPIRLVLVNNYIVLNGLFLVCLIWLQIVHAQNVAANATATVLNACGITKKRTRCLTAQGNTNECSPTVINETRMVATTKTHAAKANILANPRFPSKNSTVDAVTEMKSSSVEVSLGSHDQ